MRHIKKTGGSLVFISSLAGIRGIPGISAYCSSKMALRAIAEAIRIEEVKSNIHVGLIFVGYTEIEHDKKTIDADGALVTIRNRSGYKAQSTEQVAQAILKNIKKRKFRTTLTGLGRLNSILQRISPWLVEKVLIHSIKTIKQRS
jgi:short-subunit dehydrogenase